MFGLPVLLVAAALTSAHANDELLYTPPYVESREAFSHARTYLSEALDPHVLDIYDPETRKHYSYGILADVTAGLVMANRSDPVYNPLHVVDEHVPYAWRNYKKVALKAQELLNEASSKIRLMEELIDNICDAESIDQCNRKVQAKVDRSPFAYKLPSELLLILGRTSKAVTKFEDDFDVVAKHRTEIPHLIHSVQSGKLNDLVDDLDTAFKKLRQLQFRRFMSHFEFM